MLVLVGLGAGVVGGGLGIGGGIVMVPVLVAIGFDRHRSHATSLAAIVLISAAGAASFAAAGEIDLALGLTIGLGGVVGSALGASVMNRMSSRALTATFGVVMLVAGIRMIAAATPLAGEADLEPLVEIMIGLLIGLGAGFFAGVAGVGGGTVIVPASIFFLGMDQHMAQGTSLLAIVLTAAAGTYVNHRNGRVRLVDGLVVGAGGAVGSIIGARLALGIEGETLSVVFGILLLYVAARTLWRAARSEPQSLGGD
jgi:uncharacterized membrane protein YfcA